MSWTWLILALIAAKALFFATVVGAFYLYVRKHFLPSIARIFQERPLFIVPRGEPDESAEEISFTTSDGLTLRGCYLHARTTERSGVILSVSNLDRIAGRLSRIAKVSAMPGTMCSLSNRVIMARVKPRAITNHCNGPQIAISAIPRPHSTI